MPAQKLGEIVSGQLTALQVSSFVGGLAFGTIWALPKVPNPGVAFVLSAAVGVYAGYHAHFNASVIYAAGGYLFPNSSTVKTNALIGFSGVFGMFASMAAIFLQAGYRAEPILLAGLSPVIMYASYELRQMIAQQPVRPCRELQTLWRSLQRARTRRARHDALNRFIASAPAAPAA